MAFVKDPAFNIEVPVIANGTSFKTDWKPRILFSNTVSFTGLVYGADASFATNPEITHWNTLSTKDWNKQDTSVNSLKWDAVATYVETSSDSNNTLYNKYYKQDLELNLDPNAYMVTANMLLDANDLYDLDFRNTIFIGSKRIGESTYKLNSIKNYKAGTLAEVELIKINAPITPATPFITTNRLFLSYTGTSSSASGSGSGSGSGGSGGSTTLSGLADVEITSQQNGEVLTWDSATNRWINNTGSAVVDFEDLADVSVWNRADRDSVLFDQDASRWKNHPTVDITDVFVKRAGDTMFGSLEMVAGSRIFTDYIDSSMPFFSGFAGSGYRLGRNVDEFDLTVDNLTVRKQMKVYELEISKISAVNGGLMISAANGKAINVVGNDIYFDEDGGNKLITFAVDDYIRAQEWDGRNVSYYIGRVESIHHDNTYGEAYITVTHISNTPWIGAELVQVGNSSDTDRQNLIYLTASDDNNPYIDMLAGVTDGQFAGHTKVRLGNLSGITDVAFGGALSGYGLYADNVYLKGKIVIAAGSTVPNTTVTGLGTLSTKNSVDLATSEVTNKSLANVDNAANTKLGTIATGATVGATWGSNLSNIPSTLGTPTSAGLYLTSDYVGYWNSTSFKTYLDKNGNFILGDIAGGGTGISWSQGSGVLNIKGAINITNTIPLASISGTGSLAGKNSVDLNSGEVTNKSLGAVDANAAIKLGNIEAGATAGAIWGVNMTPPVRFADAPTGAGLVMTADYMGYYDGGSWKSYIDKYGNAKFVNVVEFGTEAVAGPWSSAQNIAIRASDIWENMGQTADSAIHINRFGRGGSQDPGAPGNYQRNLYIYDGRGNARIQVEGGGTTFNQTVGITNQASFGSFLDANVRQFAYGGQIVRPYYIAYGPNSHTIDKRYGYGSTTSSLIIMQTNCDQNQAVYLPAAADGAYVPDRGTEIVFINQSSRSLTIIGRRTDVGPYGYSIDNIGSIVDSLTIGAHKTYSVIFGGQYWCDSGGYR